MRRALLLSALVALASAAPAAGMSAAFDTPSAAPAPAFSWARVVRPISLRAAPGGRVLAEVGTRTEFGSPQTLGVVEERNGWFGVTTPALANGRLGWVRATAVLRGRTRLSISIDLSRRTLELRRGNAVVRRARVGIGRPGSTTPTGRFAVTDKLAGSNYGPYYGCCILALSARQPHLPAGWTGGDRIAIHGTNSPATIGAASSAGCPRAAARDLRLLMRRVPLGTPVFINP